MIYNVWFSQNENPRLSNLYPRGFEYKNRSYLSVEHAYQTLKSGRLSEFVYQHGNWKKGIIYKSRDFCRTGNDWNIKLMGRLILQSFLENPQLITYLKNPAYPVIPEDKEVEFSHKSNIRSEDIWTKEFPRILTIIRNHFISEVN